MRTIYAKRIFDGLGRPINSDQPKQAFNQSQWDAMNVPIRMGVEGDNQPIPRQGWTAISEAEFFGYEIPTPKEIAEAKNDDKKLISKATANRYLKKVREGDKLPVEKVIEALRVTGHYIDDMATMTSSELHKAVKDMK